MGKKEVRVIPVPKSVTVALLLVTTVAMVALIWLLSGKTYAKQTHPILETITRILQYRRISSDALLASLMPAIANILLFLPWGFLMFLALDRPSRPRPQSYAITCAVGIIFAMAVDVWQYFLPTRVTTLADSISNAIGALAGATLGDLRKRVRIRFDS